LPGAEESEVAPAYDQAQIAFGFLVPYATRPGGPKAAEGCS